ncbi:MAG: hypothetical protein MJA84_03465 [Firmicutes bacterium]|nr:hypothetical protein [Bacillota bacterium]
MNRNHYSLFLLFNLFLLSTDPRAQEKLALSHDFIYNLKQAVAEISDGIQSMQAGAEDLRMFMNPKEE